VVTNSTTDWLTHWFENPCLDLRSSDDFGACHIRNTTSLPWSRLVNSMHELPDKHQVLQLIGSSESLTEATQFLSQKGYVIEQQIPSTPEFWQWAEQQQITDSGCQSVPLWRANPRLIEHMDLIEQSTQGRRALDFACGAGRDAVYLAARGWDVTALDVKADALSRCQALADSMNCPIETMQADMESGEDHLADQTFDLIVVMRYLHRPYLPTLIDHLNAGGVLCYSTFMVGCEQFGSPRNPNYLLQPNELAQTFPQLTILVNEEHRLADGRPIALFIAQKS
jgi:tellurite methyltransferase